MKHANAHAIFPALPIVPALLAAGGLLPAGFGDWLETGGWAVAVATALPCLAFVGAALTQELVER
jgi:hypothetical protein